MACVVSALLASDSLSPTGQRLGVLGCLSFGVSRAPCPVVALSYDCSLYTPGRQGRPQSRAPQEPPECQDSRCGSTGLAHLSSFLRKVSLTSSRQKSGCETGTERIRLNNSSPTRRVGWGWMQGWGGGGRSCQPGGKGCRPGPGMTLTDLSISQAEGRKERAVCLGWTWAGANGAHPAPGRGQMNGQRLRAESQGCPCWAGKAGPMWCVCVCTPMCVLGRVPGEP